MLHLFQHPKTGFFDVATVVNGNYIVGSNQGYERRSGALKNVKAQMKVFEVETCYYQDDTGDKPVVMILLKNGKTAPAPDRKPKKKYSPAK
jgi:hypothetical protein